MSVTPSPIGGFAAQFFDNNGVILSGGKIYTYAAGTTTPQATYTSAAGVTPHANPIILDSAGRVPGGEIWLTDGLVYKFVIDTSTGILIGSYDNITGVNSNFVNYTVQEEVITATAGQTVFNLSTINYSPGTNSLTVYIDGVNQYVGDSYLETDSNTVTFTSGVHVGGEVKFTTAIQTTTGAVDASIVSYEPPFANSVATNVEAKLAQYVSVKDFGAVGDGVTDDTAEIQAALTYAATQNAVVMVPYGTYILTATLTANATLIFDGGIFEMAHTIKLNGAADLIGRNGGGVTFGNGTGYIGRTPNNYDTQILCGLDATWTGRISGMTFRVNNITNCYLISLWNAEGAEVSGNSLVDFYVANGGSLIGAPNSSTAITGANTRSQKNCNITGNTIKFAVGFTGGQLFQAYETEGLIISNNNTYGGGDDILNADRSTGITFSNNYISTRVGTIIINQVDNFNIIGNTIIKEDVGSGYDPIRATQGGILLIPTDPTQIFVAKNGVVSNNTIINNSVENMAQPMLITGVENVIVSDNVLVNKKANADFTFGVNNTSSVVPTLLPIIYNRNLVIKNNLIINGRMLMAVQGGTSADGVIATGNVANGGGYATTSMNLQGFSNTRNDFAADNIGIGATTQAQNLNNDGIGFNPRTLLNVFTANAVTTDRNLNAVGTGAYLYVPAATALDQVSMQFSAATSAGCVVYLYTYNGTTDTLVGTYTLPAGTKAKNATATDEGVKLSTVIVPSGNAVKFFLTTPGLTSVDLSINLYGSKFAFN